MDQNLEILIQCLLDSIAHSNATLTATATHTHTYIHTRIHTYIHSHTYVGTYIHTYILASSISPTRFSQTSSALPAQEQQNIPRYVMAFCNITVRRLVNRSQQFFQALWSRSLLDHEVNLQAPRVLYIGQAFHYSPDNAFYIFNQQIYFII